LTSTSRDDTKQFDWRGEPGPALGHAVIDHRRHAFANGHLVDGKPVGMFADELSHPASEFQQFEHADTPAITGLATALAAARLPKRLVRLDPQDVTAEIG